MMRCFSITNIASARKRTNRLISDHLVEEISDGRGDIQSVFRKTGVIVL